MLLVKLLCSLLFLASGTSALILTTTLASSTVTATECTTTLGRTSRSSVPTGTHTLTLLPEVALIIAVSTPVKSVTPPPVTATNTVQKYTTTTVTASTATGTFSTTTTVFTTQSETTTETVVSLTSFTDISTTTVTKVEPTPLGWIPVEKSTGQRDRPEKAKIDLQQANLRHDDLQQPLHEGRWPKLWSSRNWNRNGGFPPRFPGHGDSWDSTYPSSVNCVKYVHTHYLKQIIFVKPYYTTTTIPAATSTTMSTEVVTSTSTLIPDSVTVTESFSTTSTTTTTLTTSVTDTSSTTELVTASTTTTSYAACFTENLLGPKLDNGKYIFSPSIDTRDSIQDRSFTPSAYECCVQCLLGSVGGDKCEYSLYNAKSTMCGRLLNSAVCLGQNRKSGGLILRDDDGPGGDPSEGWTVSNGPCGSITS